MKVYFVGAGPGDPELLTIKAHRLLSECPICVYAGSLVPPEVVSVAAKAELHDSACMTLEDTVAVFKDGHKRNLDVVRLHTGDPSLYGAINEQMNALDALGIEYEVVPGVSSFQAAAAAVKTELTAPEISQTVILTRTRGRTPMPEHQYIEKLAKARATLCLFLSTHKLAELVDVLVPEYGADCPAAVVFRASWPDQLVLRGTLNDIADQVAAKGLKKTAMILVGHALGRGDAVSKLYDAGFAHEYRDASE